MRGGAGKLTVLYFRSSAREPDTREILVQVMARADFPSFDVRAVGNDPVPPQGQEHMRLLVERALFIFAHDLPLLRRVGGFLVARPAPGRHLLVRRHRSEDDGSLQRLADRIEKTPGKCRVLVDAHGSVVAVLVDQKR